MNLVFLQCFFGSAQIDKGLEFRFLMPDSEHVLIFVIYTRVGYKNRKPIKIAHISQGWETFLDCY